MRSPEVAAHTLGDVTEAYATAEEGQPARSSPDIRSQGAILDTTAAEVLAGRIHPIVTKRTDGLNVASMKEAHELIETKRTIGKIVIAV